METNIYLIRHGLTVWNSEKRLQGHHDIELNSTGLQQAEDLANYFLESGQTFSHIYASDLQRASKTAEIIAQKLQVPQSLSAELRERNLGEWGGRTVEDIQANYPNWLEIRHKGGQYGIEGTESLAKRMIERLRQIVTMHSNEHIAVVSHGGAINSVLTHLTNGDQGIDKTHIENTSITHLQFDTEWKVMSVGLIPHLTSL